MLAPVVLFVYNRPVHTARLLASLEQNTLAKETDVIVYADGCKVNASDVDIQSVQEVRALFNKNYGFMSLTFIVQEYNLGLAQSVISGVTSVIEKYGKIIVLEDDLVLSATFLEYMNAALEKYENEEQVMQISGYWFPIQANLLPDTFFLRHCSSWGWATWAASWKSFESSAQVLLSKFDDTAVKTFDYGHSFNYHRMLRKCANGQNDSWAIRWYASMFFKNGLTLFPNTSFVNNTGNDNSGVHSFATSVYKHSTLQKQIPNFTNKISENQIARKLLKNYYLKIKIKMLPSYLIYLFMKIFK